MYIGMNTGTQAVPAQDIPEHSSCVLTAPYALSSPRGSREQYTSVHSSTRVYTAAQECTQQHNTSGLAGFPPLGSHCPHRPPHACAHAHRASVRARPPLHRHTHLLEHVVVRREAVVVLVAGHVDLTRRHRHAPGDSGRGHLRSREAPGARHRLLAGNARRLRNAPARARRGTVGRACRAHSTCNRRGRAHRVGARGEPGGRGCGEANEAC